MNKLFRSTIALEEEKMNDIELSTLDVMETDRDEYEEEMTDVVAVMESLNNLSDIIKTASTANGLGATDAKLLSVTVNHVYDRVGLRKQKILPALECIAVGKDNISNTTIVLEGIVDGLKKLWQLIVDGFKKAIEWVSNFFKTVFSHTSKLISKAKNIRQRADNVKSKVGTEALESEGSSATIDNEHISNILHIGGKVPTDFNEKIKYFKQIVHDRFSTAKERVEDYDKMFTHIVKDEVLDKNVIDTFALSSRMPELARATDGINSELLNNPESLGFDKPPVGCGLVRTKELFGGKAVVGIFPKASISGDVMLSALPHIGANVKDFEPNKNVTADSKLQVLKIEDIKMLSDAVIYISEEINSYKALESSVNNLKTRFLNLADKTVSRYKETASSDDEPKNNKTYKCVERITQFYPRLVDQPLTSLSKYSVTVCKAMSDYADLSLKHYE